MRVAGSYYFAAVIVVLLSANARSQDASTDSATASSDTADKPYATIVARNIFGLLPIPPPDTTPPAPPVDPPPKITLNGIMTIFGREQALYKVANKPKPGQPAKEDSYVMGEGERQDDIEVTTIDLTNRSVTFNNHGTVQDIQLAEAGTSGSSGGGGKGGPGGGLNPASLPASLRPGAMSPADRAALYRQPIQNPGGSGAQQPLRPGYYNPANPPPGYGTASAPGFGFNNGGAGAGAANPSANQQNDNLTPEQQIMLMEAQRAKWLNDGNSAHQIIPPTPLSPNIYKEFGGGGGNPTPEVPPTP